MNREAIQETAHRILNDDPDPAVRVRLLRDVLRVEPNNLDLLDSIEELNNAQPVQLLSGDQMADGGWGRFHSRDSKSCRKTLTTELAIDRSLALGLNSETALIQRAMVYLRALVNRELPFPDPPEKNDRWSTGVALFIGAAMARLDPEDPSLDRIKGIWVEIARRMFESGVYNQESEAAAHADLTGATISGSYLDLRNKYTLVLLSACSDQLDAYIYDSLLNWLVGLPSGIGYYDVSLRPNSSLHKPGLSDRWFSSWELLTSIPQAVKQVHFAADWIEGQRDSNGFWDFGGRWRSSYFHPLSNNWRSSRKRIHDHSTRALLLLDKTA